MGCSFCEEFDKSVLVKDSRIIWENDKFLLLPTYGCFIPGYCLLMPFAHIYSFATLSNDGIIQAAYFIEEIRQIISEEFGPAIVAEHGANSCSKGAACCDHAHMHIIPCRPDKVAMLYKDVGGQPLTLLNLSDLRTWAGQPYIFLSPLPNVYWIWSAYDFDSQFVRRICAKIYGIEALYDWRKYPFKENMAITKLKLKPITKIKQKGGDSYEEN